MEVEPVVRAMTMTDHQSPRLSCLSQYFLVEPRLIFFIFPPQLNLLYRWLPLQLSPGFLPYLLSNYCSFLKPMHDVFVLSVIYIIRREKLFKSDLLSFWASRPSKALRCFHCLVSRLCVGMLTDTHTLALSSLSLPTICVEVNNTGGLAFFGNMTRPFND
jgi:hypothetical protein